MTVIGFSVSLFGLFSLVYSRNYFLMLLLSFEMVMLGLFFQLMNSILLTSLEVVVFYLLVAVCEASLGLSLLVISVSYYGEDWVIMSNFLC
uniref:NADH dehydrogenase subunit 4L n=1 Tax=Stylochyrus rarior TaxID=679428 RepID=D0UY39_STYRA|nr:NADH dehydrogenase subunit 4L [Stylochyrus rarior]ACY35983.1 NADH dehydrogenase subunit 4L [Stylochyrus rarior]